MEKERIYNGGMMSDFLSPDETMKENIARFFDNLRKEYQEKNPCPNCGSHNVEIEITTISNALVAGIEWCNDCGWEKETNTFGK